MNHEVINYEQTNAFSKIVIDYLNQHDSLTPFYHYPNDQNQIPAIIQDIILAKKLNRATLVSAIKEQYNGYIPHFNVVKSIDLLNSENTFTVTTAHQLNLFGGPLYYIYKILNTIRLCHDFKRQYPNYNFIPCYWMGSEDHDFPEINHTYLYNKRVEWDNFQDGSIGEYDTSGIEILIPQIKEIIREGDYLDKLIGILDRSFISKNLANAVRIFLDELFGIYGLVVIDGNCRSLKKDFSKILADELLSQTSFTLVTEQIDRLKKVGYKSQANPREINLFYKVKNKRDRIIPVDGGFELANSNQHFTQQELMSILEQYPERFSPNVILRPLHQQFVLPNVAYIGGGSEVTYWLQLKSLHDYYNIHYPMLVLRTSAQIFSESLIKKLDKLGLSTTDIFKDLEILKKEFIARQNNHDLLLENEQLEINHIFDSLGLKAESIDPSLKNWIGAEAQKVSKTLDNISGRLLKSEKSKNENNLQQIEKTLLTALPDGHLQERRENFMPFYAQLGPALFDQLLEILNPLEKKFYLIFP